MARKKSKINIIKLLLFLSIVAFFLYRLYESFFLSPEATEIVQYGEISIEKTYPCLIVRNEKVINSQGEGNIKYFVEEGEKVEKGYKVAEIYMDIVSEEDKIKIEELNERINDIKSNKGDLFDLDIDKLNSEIENILNEIKYYKKRKDYQNIEELKYQLVNKIDKKRRIDGDKSFAGYNLENLQEEKEIIEQRLKNSVIEIYSSESGIVSFVIDGSEEILKPENISNLTWDRINSIEFKPTTLNLGQVIFDQPILKIIDNITWYVVAATDLEDSKTFSKGQNIKIDLYDSRIEGSVIDIIPDDNQSLILIKTNEYGINFHKERKLDLNIVKELYTGLKIHRDSIIQNGDELGVYVLDVNRRATFKPIKIKGYNGNEVIIYDSYFYKETDNGTERVSTVRLYDEIVRNGKKYKEGEIIY